MKTSTEYEKHYLKVGVNKPTNSNRQPFMSFTRLPVTRPFRQKNYYDFPAVILTVSEVYLVEGKTTYTWYLKVC